MVVVGGVAFGRYLGHEVRALSNRISALTKRDTRACFQSLLCHVRIQQEGVIYKSGSRPSPDTTFASTLTMDSLASRNLWGEKRLLGETLNMVFCFSSLSWLKYPEHIKSISLFPSQATRTFRRRQNLLLHWKVELPARWQCTSLHGPENRTLEKERRSEKKGKSKLKEYIPGSSFCKKKIYFHNISFPLYISISECNWFWAKLMSQDIN